MLLSFTASGIFIMDNKELVLRLDDGALAVLSQEMKKKRDTGTAISVGDRFLIRLLGAIENDTKTLLFKMEKNKLLIRSYQTLTYDNHRQTGTENREIDGTNPKSCVCIQGC